MAHNVKLEVKVIKKFVVKTKQDRYVQFVSTPRNRHKFIDDLSHFNFFQWDNFEPVTGVEEHIIIQSLRDNGISDNLCYVISENERIDTKTLEIKRAVSETVGLGMGTILVFGDAEMIYFESETMNKRFISQRIQ